MLTPIPGTDLGAAPAAAPLGQLHESRVHRCDGREASRGHRAEVCHDPRGSSAQPGTRGCRLTRPAVRLTLSRALRADPGGARHTGTAGRVDSVGGNLKRRDFARGLAAAGAAGCLGVRASATSADAPPETTRIRIAKVPAICLAAQYVAEDLLRAEGFTDVQYVEMPLPQIASAVATGTIDVSAETVTDLVMELESGGAIVIITGLHVGCYELVAGHRVRRIPDLKGKTIAVADRGRRAFIASMAVQVGLDPQKDIQWVEKSGDEAISLLADGKLDAYLGFPPEPQEMRAKNIGRVILNTAKDRPWAQYFCCMVFLNPRFVRQILSPPNA